MATRYSLVIPVYRNEESIPDLLTALAGIDRALGGGLEVVFVVDGSPDRSLARLVELAAARGLHREDPRDVAQLRRVRGDSRRTRRGLGSLLRGDGRGSAGAAGARRRVLPPPGAGRLRRRLRRAHRARRSLALAARVEPVLGGVSTARPARDAAGRRRRLRLQRRREGRARRADRIALEPRRTARVDRHAARRSSLPPPREAARQERVDAPEEDRLHARQQPRVLRPADTPAVRRRHVRARRVGRSTASSCSSRASRASSSSPAMRRRCC